MHIDAYYSFLCAMLYLLNIRAYAAYQWI